MSVKDIITELFKKITLDGRGKKITLDGRGYNKSASISVATHEDADHLDIEVTTIYISRKFSKLHAVIIPYHGSVKPFTHGNRGLYDLQKAEERLSRDIKRMGIPVFFMQHFKDFDKLPKTKQEKIEDRLIPMVHKTLQVASELSRNKNMENLF